MKGKQRKKAQERLILDYFNEITSLCKGGRIVCRESPDFECRTRTSRCIAIELVTIPHADDSRTGQEILVRQALEVKLGKLPSYRSQRFTEYWLIIWADHFEEGLSNSDLSGYLPEDTFHRVFLFSLFQPFVSLVSGHRTD